MGHTRITAVTPHSFTTANAAGFPAVTWKPGDQYALDWGSEFGALLSLYAASSTPGRLTANISNVNFINERDSYGLFLQNNVNLTASNLYGANIHSVVCPVECFCNMKLTGLSDDGIGTAAATVGGIRIPGLYNILFNYEVDPDAEGYSRGKYNNSTHPNAGAPNNFTVNNIRFTNLDSFEQNPAGLYDVHNYNNMTATGTTGFIFFWDGDTNRTTINNSCFNSGYFSGNYQYAVQFQPGTELIENTAFLGLKNPNFGTGGDLYHIAAIMESPGGKIPYSVTFSNATFDVDSSVTKGGFPGIGAMCCTWSDNKTSRNTLNLKGGSVSANVIDAVVNAQVCNINGTTFHNTGYLWRQLFCPANAAHAVDPEHNQPLLRQGVREIPGDWRPRVSCIPACRHPDKRGGAGGIFPDGYSHGKRLAFRHHGEGQEDHYRAEHQCPHQCLRLRGRPAGGWERRLLPRCGHGAYPSVPLHSYLLV